MEPLVNDETVSISDIGEEIMWWPATITLVLALTGSLFWYVRTQTYWQHEIRRLPFVIAVILVITVMFFQVRWDVGVFQVTQTLKVASGNKDATLHCENFFEQAVNLFPNRLGTVWYDNPDRTVIRHHTCNDLISWHQSFRQEATPEQGLALHVLFHEAQHIAGSYDETYAECQALEVYPEVIKRVGGTYEDGVAWRDRYETTHHNLLPAKYLKGCETVPPAKILLPPEPTQPPPTED